MHHALIRLTEEHRLIERALDALAQFARGLRPESGQLDRWYLRRSSQFLRGFVDELHHGKEERWLFPAMVAAGFSARFGPIPVMLSEHEQGRALTEVLARLAHGPPAANSAEITEARRSVLSYTQHLRDHIKKEDNVLYPMALGRLGPDALDTLELQLRRHDEDFGAEARARLLELAGVLDRCAA